MNHTRFSRLIFSVLALSALVGTLVIAARATGVLAADPIPLIKRGIPQGTVPPQPSLRPPATPGPQTCGDWAAPSGAVGSMIAARHGEVRSCQVIGDEIVIVASGAPQKGLPGAIALYQCAPQDATCHDGRTPHPATGWQFFPPPYVGAVGILERSSPDTLIISDADHQMCFNLQTHTYDTHPSCR